MRISNVQNAEQNIIGPAGTGMKDLIPDRALMFRHALSTLSTEQHQRYMTVLMHKIDEQGQRLVKKADIKELQIYRELISEFIKEMVSNSFSFDKKSSYEARRRHKVFATVNKINVKLEELAQEMLLAQADNLAILNKVDDIRGLILDIML
jgi:uncharacterized protein YaaR (DUF327 family)